MKRLLLFGAIAISINAFAQNVNIPDPFFKSYLLSNVNINTNGDTEIQSSEANSFTGTIYCDKAFISDLTGIEAFTSIHTLYCAINQLTSLDVTQNTFLTTLLCYNNQLTSLDVSQNVFLTHLQCEDNQLECLNVKNQTNTAFSILYANGNPNLTCVEVDDVSYSMNNWNNALFEFDVQTSFSTDCNNACSMSFTGIGELNTTSKQLLKIVDLMGIETTFKSNTPLIYVYDDGTTEKVFTIED